MLENLEVLKFYFTFPFVRYALLVGVLIALSSSLIGVVLVLKRYSYLGEGLSHVAFGATIIASILNVTNNMIIVIPITVITSIILLTIGENKKIKSDAIIAMISVSALSIGYFLISLFGKSANISGDICTTLFGSTSILTLSELDVYSSIVFSVLVIGVFILFYNRIFAITFDEDFAKVSGVNTKKYKVFIATIISIIIVLSINLVGTLLITALIIFPALSSMRIFNTFKKVIVFSAIISVIASSSGIIVSILYSTPIGSTIVIINLIIFVIMAILGALKK